MKAGPYTPGIRVDVRAPDVRRNSFDHECKVTFGVRRWRGDDLLADACVVLAPKQARKLAKQLKRAAFEAEWLRKAAAEVEAAS